jgi:hypothetical protein
VSQQKRQGSKGKSPSKYRDSERRQGRRFVFVWLPAIVVVVLFFYAFVFDPPRPAGQPIPGISRDSEQARFGETAGKAYMAVLDDGRVVNLAGSQMGSLEAGRRVLVQENTTLIFKKKSFSFVRYLE